jgi:hypothetical protein
MLCKYDRLYAVIRSPCPPEPEGHVCVLRQCQLEGSDERPGVRLLSCGDWKSSSPGRHTAADPAGHVHCFHMVMHISRLAFPTQGWRRIRTCQEKSTGPMDLQCQNSQFDKDPPDRFCLFCWHNEREGGT